VKLCIGLDPFLFFQLKTFYNFAFPRKKLNYEIYGTTIGGGVEG